MNEENKEREDFRSYPTSSETPVFWRGIDRPRAPAFHQRRYITGPHRSISGDIGKTFFQLGRTPSNKALSPFPEVQDRDLMIAMGLLRTYRILIADEPSTGLDPETNPAC